MYIVFEKPLDMGKLIQNWKFIKLTDRIYKTRRKSFEGICQKEIDAGCRIRHLMENIIRKRVREFGGHDKRKRNKMHEWKRENIRKEELEQINNAKRQKDG
jgi:hypothetical protein